VTSQKYALAHIAITALLLLNCSDKSASPTTESSSSTATSSTIASSSATHSSSSFTDVLISSSSVIASSSNVVSSSTTQTISNGTLTDSRDGQAYKTVVIGSQTWMAQNLNYTPTSGNSWCYSNTASNCTTYGRLYDWATALTACPTGWHLPDTTAWNTLETYAGGSALAGNKLKAVSSLWATYSGIINTDDYGFSALPGGYYDGSLFHGVGSSGDWWASTPNGTTDAYGRYMYDDDAFLSHTNGGQASGFSVRCLKDTP